MTMNIKMLIALVCLVSVAHSVSIRRPWLWPSRPDPYKNKETRDKYIGELMDELAQLYKLEEPNRLTEQEKLDLKNFEEDVKNRKEKPVPKKYRDQYGDDPSKWREWRTRKIRDIRTELIRLYKYDRTSLTPRQKKDLLENEEEQNYGTNCEERVKWDFITSGLNVKFQNVKTQRYLSSSSTGIVKMVSESKDDGSQDWQMIKSPSKRMNFFIVNKKTGEYLESNMDGKLFSKPRSGKLSQRWKIDDDKKQIVNVSSGKILDFTKDGDLYALYSTCRNYSKFIPLI